MKTEDYKEMNNIYVSDDRGFSTLKYNQMYRIDFSKIKDLNDLIDVLKLLDIVVSENHANRHPYAKRFLMEVDE